MTATTIRYGWDRPVPLPGDFIFTTAYVERAVIADKREGFAIYYPVGGGYTANIAAASPSSNAPAYFIFVMTDRGDLRITVSKKVYDCLEIGDNIVVEYQKGRWTGALKGNIAR